MTLSAIQRHILALLASFGIVTSAAGAWGAPGHRTVGAIADELLKDHPRAAAQVRAILGNISLEQAGPWGDCVRSVPGPSNGFRYAPDKEEYRIPCRAFESGARLRSMESYVRNNWDNWAACAVERDGCHSQYHFVNMALRSSGYRFGEVGTREYDIVHAMNAAIAVLRTSDCSGANPPATTEVHAPGRFHYTCSQALMMLVHLMGDLHQPLHVGSIYLDERGRPVDPNSSQAERDRALVSKVTFTAGGNFLTSPAPDGGSSNLHTLWDRAPVFVMRDAAAAARGVSPTTGPMDGWVEKWARDTLVQARAAFDPLSFGRRQGVRWAVAFDGPQSQSRYEGAREAAQRAQIPKAGARLAQLLTAIWPDR